MKVAVVGDLHLADNPPSLRVDNYKEAILNKVRFILHSSLNEGVSAVCFLGDIFHKKIPSHNSHSLIRELISILNDNPLPKLTIAGNHDISGTEQNLQKQPISVLVESGAVQFVTDKMFYLDGGSFKLGIYGHHYTTSKDNKNNIEEYNPPENDADIILGLFHQMILPDGMSFFENYINFSDMHSLPIDIVAVGHYHGGFEPALQSSKGKWFLNPGAVSRGSSDDTTLNRQPKFTILNIDYAAGNKVISSYDVQIPVEPAESVFDVNKVERRKELSKLKDFVNKLSDIEMNTSEISTEYIVRLLKQFGMPDRLEHLAVKYLEGS